MDYVPTTEPGRRMPHQWLTPDRSTFDVIGEWFTPLTLDPRHWKQQAAASWPLHIEPLTSEYTDRSDLGPRGAVLIRPRGRPLVRPTTLPSPGPS
ncbi:hypothetical protein [Nocardia sp. NPDC004604]|uniref:aromatic-ring hydroxylase C-terminal domain-containing protein n=1 Tax=Nocardia sp. NPDC004604 TaxID=3157013 RepID=UPI0033BA7971